MWVSAFPNKTFRNLREGFNFENKAFRPLEMTGEDRGTAGVILLFSFVVDLSPVLVIGRTSFDKKNIILS